MIVAFQFPFHLLSNHDYCYVPCLFTIIHFLLPSFRWHCGFEIQNQVLCMLRWLQAGDIARQANTKRFLHSFPHQCYVCICLCSRVHTQDEDATVPVSFVCLYQRAKKKGDVLLGYVDADGVVQLNPKGKAEPNITFLSVESFVTISCDLM